MNNKEIFYWYVLKTIFSRETKVKQLLDERNIKSFVPMQYKIRQKEGKKIKVLEPAIRDLVFVYAQKTDVEQFKKELFVNYGFDAYFLTRKNGLKRVIETIPEKQMQDFINVASHVQEDIAYFSPEDLELQKGTKVKVIGGLFDGIEGVLTRVKGKRCKRIVIEIPGLAIATSYVEPDLIQIIKD
ncbi:MAG: UpxY family transcription antiterminator [Bacteroidota bacterium]|nr:UpxY family transcription antiterminator [Bacteroidota bacterium]